MALVIYRSSHVQNPNELGTVRIRTEMSRLEQLGLRMKAHAGASYGPLLAAVA